LPDKAYHDVAMSYLDDIKTVLGKKKKADNAAVSKPQIKVLIVEDESVLREMYRDKLEHEGFEVIAASNGKEGLEMAIAKKPRLILLDLMMPIMDGKTMLRRLRAIPDFKKLPVIILTNAGDVENIKETQRYENASEFLIKSNINIDDVIKKIRELTIFGYKYT
jgi:DNA-binding response OmpR family regulator